MRVVLALMLSWGLLFGELYKIEDFEADLFSRHGNKLKKVQMQLMLEGENLRQNDYKILDALNVVISSFYIEDLFTSKGKERFKSLLRKYLLKKYMIDPDFIYILRLDLKEQVDIDTLLEKLKTLETSQIKAPRTAPPSDLMQE